MKYVLVTGGVVSGLGKGVTASSIGLLLKACGLRVTAIKIDPYLNTDAGTMSPIEHGEVYVLDDGGEVDLDLGNYERFMDVKLTRDNNITTGKIYQASDIESMPFIQALGHFSYRVGANNFCLVHVSLVPVLNVVGEQKTKPTQHSVRGLRSQGLSPQILACRSTMVLDENAKAKLSQFCLLPGENIITLYDVPNIWHIPLLLRDQKAHEAIFKVLNLQGMTQEPDLDEWTCRAEACDLLHEPVRIALVGKYTCLSDSYLSVLKALIHASVSCQKKLTVDWISATNLEDATAKESPDAYKAAWKLLKGADGVLIPGGFGDRGVQGKIIAAKYARVNRIPYLGICLGMQVAVIEFARSVLGLKDANSTEFEPNTKSPCVIFMPEGSKTHMGGTMRLGSRRTYFQTKECKSAKLYGGKSFIDERHRHRYEVNPDLVTRLEKSGLSFTGKDETGQRMEIVEIPNHPYFIGVQFHPEFKSRPGNPSPVFLGFIAAACGQLEAVMQHSSRGVSNDISSIKTYQNGSATKAQAYRQEYVYGNGIGNGNGNVNGNGNGLHY
ncbi:hypothetical protein TSUD_190040 [Trifolium subterraneum]|uniref:CTP synthase n=1 Tax=Trifolium subterraneum TaxID=3900 RepID=A0A2Z6PBM8_TRISU|nr:hypothetical protein TSUD_190040 [Trifolium subterraneum]